MRGLIERAFVHRITASLFVVWCAPFVASCVHPCAEPSAPLEAAHTYEAETCARRAAMEASVAAADTPYGTLRTAHYALGDGSTGDWDSLPVFSRPVRRLRVRGGSASDAALDQGPVMRLETDDIPGYVAAGERAFTRYPIQIDLGLSPLRDRTTAERMGFTVEDDGLVRGVIEVETSTGWTVSLTCAGCHAREIDGVEVLGVPSERIDLGSLLGHLEWPIGSVDVTSDGIANPIRPADLRPIAYQSRLQHTGNLFNSRIARMVRIETLMISQLSENFRPERDVVAAIALFLEAEGNALPRPDSSHEGAALFSDTCGGCHRGEALSGPPVSVDVVGTDAVATTGGQRGTGAYRAPSLLGVAERRGLFHDGSAADLSAVLGLTESTHAGHRFGLALSREERERIADYLGAR